MGEIEQVLVPESKSLVVCADDFGNKLSVSNAIVRLIDARRISATSVLVLGQDSARSAPRLVERRAACSVGLHFSLTDASGWRSWVPLPLLLACASLRLLKPDAVRERITRQLDRFEELFGTPPDFLDGHEHVHQFPSIREIVLEQAVGQ